jgi:hypothetical protein
MKHRLRSTLLAIVVLVVPVLPAAETKSAPPAGPGKAAASTLLAGEYTGTWNGRGESSGALRIKLKQEGGAWVAEAGFTFEGNEVVTKVTSVQVEGARVEMVFAWEIQGTAAQSKLSGEWSGAVIEGKYENTTQEGPANGTWKVTRN